MRFDPQSNYITDPNPRVRVDQRGGGAGFLFPTLLLLFMLGSASAVGYWMWSEGVFEPARSAASTIDRFDDPGLDLVAMSSPPTVGAAEGVHDQAAEATQTVVPLQDDIAISPGRDLHERGQRLLSMGQYVEAAALLEEAVELDPTWIDARYHLGLALVQCGRTVAADHQADLLAEQSPSHANLLRNLTRAAN